MKYERLTLVLPNGEVRVAETKFNSDKAKQKAIDRLAELEDKIEAGTLIELPFARGTRIYAVCGVYEGVDNLHIQETTVTGYEIWLGQFSKTKNKLLVETSLPYKKSYMEVDNVFLTKAEAEKRIKELRGEV